MNRSQNHTISFRLLFYFQILHFYDSNMDSQIFYHFSYHALVERLIDNLNITNIVEVRNTEDNGERLQFFLETLFSGVLFKFWNLFSCKCKRKLNQLVTNPFPMMEMQFVVKMLIFKILHVPRNDKFDFHKLHL